MNSHNTIHNIPSVGITHITCESIPWCMNKEQGMNPMQCRLALSRNEEWSHALTWTNLENTQKWQETGTCFMWLHLDQLGKPVEPVRDFPCRESWEEVIMMVALLSGKALGVAGFEQQWAENSWKLLRENRPFLKGLQGGLCVWHRPRSVPRTGTECGHLMLTSSLAAYFW